MKTNLFSRLVVLIAFISLATSCKKDNFADSTVAHESTSELSTLKKWYEQQQSGVAAKSSPQNGTVDWAKTSSFLNDGNFISPVKISVNSNVSKFLVTSLYKGEVAQAKFVYVISSDKKASSPETLKLAAENKIPNAFNGVVLEYDIVNKLIHSVHYENGKAINSKKDILFYKRSNDNSTGLPSGNSPTLRQCWGMYLNTYENGVLVNSILLYTFCEQNTETTDTVDSEGGGGNSEGTDTVAVVECQQIKDALNSLTVSTVPGYSYRGEESMSNTGEITAPKPCTGIGHTYSCLWWHTTFRAFYDGVVYKNQENEPWKWKSFSFANFSKSEGRFPPCLTYAVTSHCPTTISADEMRAQSFGDYQLTITVACGVDSEVKTYPGIIGDYFSSNY